MTFLTAHALFLITLWKKFSASPSDTSEETEKSSPEAEQLGSAGLALPCGQGSLYGLLFWGSRKEQNLSVPELSLRGCL